MTRQRPPTRDAPTPAAGFALPAIVAGKLESGAVVPLPPEQDQNVRGSIEDVERRLSKAQGSLQNAVESLDRDDPQGADDALEEAGSQIEAAGKEAGTTRYALKVARERQQP